ncbi:MAG TPA: hypothetical protein VGY32_03145 [Solirubrobacteraceae bacterium]|nr:hypothetical protein [Solirubrobacteraceae bacterium]
MQNTELSSELAVDQLSQLVYELLDAHVDTICMGEDVCGHLEWEAHLEYLRSLQRVSREMLASLDTKVAIS